MVPTRLRLRNFLSYGGEGEELDLAGIQVACLCGPNGHGKSALLDAITWVLWGKARSDTDSLIRAGQSEMLVELDFRLDGQSYRITRRRSLGGSGQSDLQLQIQEPGGGWKSQSGQGLRGTQRAVTRLLRLDYDAFVNSAFVLQGRADEFSRRRPGERKQILAEVLGLGEYEALCGMARSRSADAKARALALDEEIERLQTEQGELPRHRERLSALQIQLEELQGRLDAARKLLQETVAERTRLEERQKQHADLDRRLQQARGRLEVDRQLLTATEQSLRKGAAVLERADAIRKRAQEAGALRQEQQNQAQALSTLRDLERAREAARNRLLAAEHALRRRIDLARQRAGQLQASADRLPAIRGNVAGLRAATAGLDALDERLTALRGVATRLAEERSALLATRAQTTATLEEANERFQALKHAQAICPVCESDLPEAKRRSLGFKLRDQRRELTSAIEASQAREKEIDGGIETNRQEQLALDRKRREGMALREKLSAALQQEAELTGSEEQAAEAQRELAALEKQAAEGPASAEDAQEVQRIEGEIRAVPYDAERVRRIEARLRELEGAERELEALTHAESEQPGLTERRDSLATSLRLLAEQLAADDAALGTLAQEIRALPQIRQREADQGREVNRLEGEAGGLTREQAAVEGLIRRCEEIDSLVQERRKERDASARDQALYAELTRAFGRDGIPALIIENAVPEIESNANEILERLTGGQLIVRLQTRRNLRKGGQGETLEIQIGDGMGFRPYELFSGGEAFRVNFALRIALSRLLAHRAGARLETLFIDEGFGTQDEEGRRRLVEAIQSVQSDFACILVITHLDELKEAFPVRIEVTKGPSGSRAMIV